MRDLDPQSIAGRLRTYIKTLKPGDKFTTSQLMLTLEIPRENKSAVTSFFGKYLYSGIYKAIGKNIRNTVYMVIDPNAELVRRNYPSAPPTEALKTAMITFQDLADRRKPIAARLVEIAIEVEAIENRKTDLSTFTFAELLAEMNNRANSGSLK